MLGNMKGVEISSVFILGVVATIGGEDSASIKKRWQCTSAESQFTNSYCEAQGNIQGCYYLLHFSQYRSCASVCNDVLSDSLTDTARCDDFCPGYLSGYGDCLLVTDSGTTATNRPIEDKTLLSTTPTNAVQIALSVLAAGVIVAAAIGFVIYKRKCKKKSASNASGSQTSTPLMNMRRSDSAQGNNGSTQSKYQVETEKVRGSKSAQENTGSTQPMYSSEPPEDDTDAKKDYENSFLADAVVAV